jgi:hypothetical protein
MGARVREDERMRNAPFASAAERRMYERIEHDRRLLAPLFAFDELRRQRELAGVDRTGRLMPHLEPRPTIDRTARAIIANQPALAARIRELLNEADDEHDSGDSSLSTIED